MQQPVDRAVVSADGTPIATTSRGAGPAVVLVGGAFDHRGTPSVERFADSLASRYRVVTFDRRGRGASGDTEPWSIGREVEDLDAIVRSIDGPVTAVGLCVGAGLVLQALAAGVPFDRAVLYEAPYRATVDPHADDVVFADTLDEHIAAGRRAAAVRAFATQVLGLQMGQVTALRLKSGLWKALLADAHVLPRDVRVLNGLAIPERLVASVGVPVLVGAGTESPAWLGQAARALVEAVPGSASFLLPGEGHVPEPAVLGAVLDRFVPHP